MRVTGQMMAGTVARNLVRLREWLTEGQTKLATGMRIHRPSDDPARVLDSMKVRSAFSELSQFETAIIDGRGWLGSSESALTHLVEQLGRVRELAVAGGQGTHTTTSLSALAQEVTAIRDELLGVVNETHAGYRLFGGHLIDAKPFTVDPDGHVVYAGNDGVLQREVGPGIVVEVNINGEQLLAGGDFFALLQRLADNLSSGDVTAVSTVDLAELDGALDWLTALRSQVGVRYARLDYLEGRAVETRVALAEMQAQAEGIDVARTLIELNEAEAAYQTALAAGARIIPPTLLDFMR